MMALDALALAPAVTPAVNPARARTPTRPGSALQAQARLNTPLGALTLAATAQGLAGAWFDAQAHHPGPLPLPHDPHQRWLRLAALELTRYFDDPGAGFTVALDAAGTPFQRSVWQLLGQIAPGETAAYGDIAQRLGRPQAARAVGAAVGRNPLSIVVPCHRVCGRSGALTGYAGGLDRKRALLAHERGLGAAEAPSAAPISAPPSSASVAPLSVAPDPAPGPAS